MVEAAAEMGHRGTLLAYQAAWAGLRWVPEPVGRWLFTRLADLVWRRRSHGIVRLERNLRRVVPAGSEDELRSLSRAGMRSYMRYFFEMFRLPALDADTVRARTHSTGIEELEAHIAQGRGVVAALPHMGNWEHAGAWIGGRGIPVTTVAERLRPVGLFQRFVAYREQLGIEVLPLDTAASTLTTLVQRLRDGGLVCLLADRDLTGTGVEVSFFGEPARLPAGPAALALATGAALMPVGLWYDGPRLRVRVRPELLPPPAGSRAERVRALTQRLATVFEQEIAEHPHDWHMLQRVFTADLPTGTGERV